MSADRRGGVLGGQRPVGTEDDGRGGGAVTRRRKWVPDGLPAGTGIGWR